MNAWKCTIALAVFVTVGVPLCVAQTPPQETVITKLAHVECETLASSLNNLGYPVMTACVGPSSIIVQGPSDQVKLICDQLIPAWDVAEVAEDSEDVSIIRLTHQPSRMLMELIRAAVSGPKTRIAIDDANRLLVIRAGEAETEAVRQLLKEVDRPSQSFNIHLFVIRASVGNRNGKEASLPAGLKSVAHTLTENGFGDLDLLAPVMLTADEGQSFSQESALSSRDPVGYGDSLKISVAGTARLDSDEDLVQLKLRTEVTGEFRTEEDHLGETNFAIDTTLVAKIGSYVVLAAAPASTADGEAIAVAVKVTRN